jgi:hypothetical protein
MAKEALYYEKRDNFFTFVLTIAWYTRKTDLQGEAQCRKAMAEPTGSYRVLTRLKTTASFHGQNYPFWAVSAAI